MAREFTRVSDPSSSAWSARPALEKITEDTPLALGFQKTTSQSETCLYLSK
jgi:hypothetical protein